jgi:hypothetical protein
MIAIDVPSSASVSGFGVADVVWAYSPFVLHRWQIAAFEDSSGPALAPALFAGSAFAPRDSYFDCAPESRPGAASVAVERPCHLAPADTAGSGGVEP